jgi:hypothetical protein
MPAGNSVLGAYPASECDGATLVQWAEGRLKEIAAGADPRRPPGQVQGRLRHASRRGSPQKLSPAPSIMPRPHKASAIAPASACVQCLLSNTHSLLPRPAWSRPPPWEAHHHTRLLCPHRTPAGASPATAAPWRAARRRPAAAQAAEAHELGQRSRPTLAERQDCLGALLACGCSAPPLQPVQPAPCPKRLPLSCTASASASSGRNYSSARCMLVITQQASNSSKAGNSWPTASSRQLLTQCGARLASPA